MNVLKIHTRYQNLGKNNEKCKLITFIIYNNLENILKFRLNNFITPRVVAIRKELKAVGTSKVKNLNVEIHTKEEKINRNRFLHRYRLIK